VGLHVTFIRPFGTRRRVVPGDHTPPHILKLWTRTGRDGLATVWQHDGFIGAEHGARSTLRTTTSSALPGGQIKIFPLESSMHIVAVRIGARIGLCCNSRVKRVAVGAGAVAAVCVPRPARTLASFTVDTNWPRDCSMLLRVIGDV
jgi:hypothetical protein